MPCLTLSNIVLQGAAFDGVRLRALDSDSPVNSAMPNVLIAWVPQQMQDPSAAIMAVPLYNNPERGSVIAQLQLPVTSQDLKRQFVLAGLGACLLS